MTKEAMKGFARSLLQEARDQLRAHEVIVPTALLIGGKNKLSHPIDLSFESKKKEKLQRQKLHRAIRSQNPLAGYVTLDISIPEEDVDAVRMLYKDWQAEDFGILCVEIRGFKSDLHGKVYQMYGRKSDGSYLFGKPGEDWEWPTVWMNIELTKKEKGTKNASTI